MNIPRTIVALMTLASETDTVTEEMCEHVQQLVAGATEIERAVLIASLANLQSYTLRLLEESTNMSRAVFLHELGLDIAATEDD